MKLMQIIAEISEDDYNRIINKSYRSNVPDYSAAEYAIAHGTPIPDNATNGDIIKAMFPKREVIDKDWWNAPYYEEDDLT